MEQRFSSKRKKIKREAQERLMGDVGGTDHYRVIPSEKTEKKPTPLKCDFFAWKLIIGLINDDLCRFWPSGARWGARGAPEGFWGVRRTQNCQFPYGTKLSSEMLGFGPRQLVTLCF